MFVCIKRHALFDEVVPPFLLWVKECWEVVLVEIVQKCFCVCRISMNTYGMKNEEIHWLKEGGVAADAREAICRETAMLDPTELEESDPFADVEEDEEELQTYSRRLLKFLSVYCYSLLVDCHPVTRFVHVRTCYLNTQMFHCIENAAT